MSGDRAILHLSRALADQDLRGDERLAPPTRARSRHAQRSAGSPHTTAVPGSSSASLLSGGAPPAPHATVPSLPGNPDRRSGSPHFAAALARPSMPLAPGGERSPARQGPALAIAPSPRAPQKTGTALTAAWLSATNERVPSRPPHETTGNRPAETPPPPSPHPRLKALRPPKPRTAADAPAAQQMVAQATATCHAKPDPNAADPPSHLPLLPRCCDGRLNPPSIAASSFSA